MAIKPLAVNLREAHQTLGIGRDKMLELIHEGKVRHVRVGRRIVIPVSALQDFLDGRVEQEAQ